VEESMVEECSSAGDCKVVENMVEEYSSAEDRKVVESMVGECSSVVVVWFVSMMCLRLHRLGQRWPKPTRQLGISF